MPAVTLDIDKLVALHSPIICVDTCTILDILRDPTRKTVRENEQRAAIDLLIAIRPV